MFHTLGIDVGCSSIKSVVMTFDDKGQGEQLVGSHLDKIRKRNIKDVIHQSYERILAEHNLSAEDIAYVASTGEGELVDFKRGHFYSMTTHARGALFLDPEVRAVVDVGALHSKALIMDERSKVLSYRMTSQCASGTGQFLENISRYLGVSIDEVGPLSLQAHDPEIVSGICAVLAETDVINMVSRGITPSNILKGIHQSIGKRLINLLRMVKAEGNVLVTGGLSRDTGLLGVMRELAEQSQMVVDIRSHKLSIFAGAIGASIWGGFRHVKLSYNKPSTLGASRSVHSS
ncbi:MAG: benzoyl-CoA reductase subunit D [Candidatus Krumholzibacteria bacterium]|nr:benzoyl-CoA reductase subunit D [Candidatus Krumholzibacteria bacterium]